jgi:hypothetical protein
MNEPTQQIHQPRIADDGSGLHPDPWSLVWGQPYIDATRLATAIEHDLQHTPHPDFRTRLLVRDAVRAIQSFWGRKRVAEWLGSSPAGTRIRAILGEDLGEPGFPHIRRRLVASPSAIQIGQIVDLLGRRIQHRVEVNIAGSIPTLIKGLTAQPTAHIDFVDEVLAEVRKQRTILRQIRDTYGLDLGHVQSHSLPANWERRRSYLGDYGGLRVHLVNEYDIFVSKLSSKQEKHKDDLRVLAQQLDKEKARNLLLTDGKGFLDDPSCDRKLRATGASSTRNRSLRPKPREKARQPIPRESAARKPLRRSVSENPPRDDLSGTKGGVEHPTPSRRVSTWPPRVKRMRS